MRTQLESILTIIVCAAMLGGCASIMHGTTQEMSFQSNPDGVTVTVTGRVLGKTPFTVQLDKKKDQSVIFTKEGYKPVTMELTTTLDPWFWGNIVLGGLIGSTTDGLSGAVHQYSPSQYFVSLQPEGVMIESSTLKSQREKAKEFIVSHYENLVSDLSKGSGENVSALMLLLNIGKDKEDDALNKMRALSELFKDAPTFADQVIVLYLK